MALSNVEQAVLQKAEDEVRKTLDEASEAAEALLQRRTARLREEHERRVEATHHELESELERETGARDAADRLELLKLKNEIIEEVFEKAVAGIRSLPDNGYAGWIKAQVAALPPMDEAVLVANAQDQSFLQDAVAAAQRSDLKTSDQPAAIKGGFLVQGAQADLDFSIEALMGTLRDSLTEDISQKLFGEGKA